MKIFSIVGARPQFIKLAPLSNALAKDHQEFIVHTGQHYDYAMSEKIFNDLEIRKPDIHLETRSGSQASQTAEMMVKLEKEMMRAKPDIVIVFGDTNSTIAGTLSAAKLNIPIIHIEAGLRSYNRTMPEEINRIVCDHISQYLFVPTTTALKILKKEGLENNSFFTGDLMIDTMKNNLEIALKKSKIVGQLHLEEENYNLLTLHRNYNVDNKLLLENILNQLSQLNEQIIFPMHPRTRKMISPTYSIPANIIVTEPKGYLDFITLEKHAKRIITDSGGIQKEAYILKKTCITLRTETEWVETVEEKWNLLINPTDKKIAQKILKFKVPKKQKKIFGKDVTKKMVAIINTLK